MRVRGKGRGRVRGRGRGRGRGRARARVSTWRQLRVVACEWWTVLSSRALGRVRVRVRVRLRVRVRVRVRVRFRAQRLLQTDAVATHEVGHHERGTARDA